MNRLKYLDGLRGIAALAVVLHHFLLAFYPAVFSGRPYHSHFPGFQFDVFVARSPLDLFAAGNFAVCIFFVLSGMVLSRQFLITKNPVVLSEQAVRRYFRLIIPIAASMLIAYLMIQSDCFYNKPAAIITKSDFWLAELWPRKFTVLQFLYIAFIDSVLNNAIDIINVLWTMNIEFNGSFLVFAMLALSQYLSRRWLIYALLVGSQLWLHHYYYICFIAGVMMMDAEVNDLKWLRHWRAQLSIGIFILSLLLGSFPSGTEEYLGSFYSYWFLPIDQCSVFYHSIGAILLVASINNLPWIQKQLEAKSCTFLGRISFSMYLLHSLVLGSVILLAFLHIYPQVSYGWAVLLLLLPYLGLTFVCSYFFAIYVDEKSTVISKTIYVRYFKK